MLELSRIRNEKAAIIEALKKRNINAEKSIDEILQLDLECRGTKQELDKTLEELNGLAREIGLCFKEGNIEKGNQLKEKTVSLKSHGI